MARIIKRSVVRMSGTRARTSGKRVSVAKRRAPLDATMLGIAPGQLVRAVRSFQAADEPPQNLPVAESGDSDLRVPRFIHRPLTSPRASFWLGVGFGVLIVGSLALLTWELLKFEVVEAVVVGLARP